MSTGSVEEGLVSTVIPVYNRPELLREAVASVLAQTYRPIEIVIVDDGSTDRTPEVIESIVSSSPDVVRSLRVENAGPGRAREAGRGVIRGEFVQYLDSDDLLRPAKFEVQVGTLRERPECGVAYGLTTLVDDDGETLEERYLWPGEAIRTLYPRILVSKCWTTQNPLYRRTVTDLVGPWASMRIGEDWEYDARVGALGTELAFVDAEVSDHRAHGGEQLTDGRWSGEAKLEDQVVLVESLWRGARRCGLPGGSPEIDHFGRWCFLLARRAAARGRGDLSLRRLRLAARTGGVGPRLGRRIFRLAGAIVGWRRAAAWAEGARRLFRRGAAGSTERAV